VSVLWYLSMTAGYVWIAAVVGGDVWPTVVADRKIWLPEGRLAIQLVVGVAWPVTIAVLVAWGLVVGVVELARYLRDVGRSFSALWRHHRPRRRSRISVARAVVLKYGRRP